MLTGLLNWFDKSERRLRYSFGHDIRTRKGRFLSQLHFQLFDHAFLRTVWHNFDRIAPGVYRSNQPSHARFRRYADMGIKTIINLRGDDKRAQYLFEEESCRKLGLTLINVKLYARNAPGRWRLVNVIDALRAAEKPLLFHCKSGADRTGFVGAMYLLIFEGATIAQARRQLSIAYIHLKWTKTGVQDYMLDVFEARQQKGEIDMETWIREEYDQKRIQDGFDRKRPPSEVA